MQNKILLILFVFAIEGKADSTFPSEAGFPVKYIGGCQLDFKK